MAEEEAPAIDASASDSATHVCDGCGRSFGSRFSLSAHKRTCKGPGQKAKAATSDDEGDDSATSANERAATSATPRQRKPRIPARSGKRHDCSGLLGPLWAQLARFVPSVPAQRAMVWQAPGAGRVLDNALAGSVVDKWVLQKVSGVESKYKPAVDLVTLPAALIMVEKQPALFPVLRPILASTIKANLEAALDAAAAEKADEDKLRAKAEAAGLEWEAEEVDPETGKTVKVSIVEAILRDLMAPADAFEPDAAAANGQ